MFRGSLVQFHNKSMTEADVLCSRCRVCSFMHITPPTHTHTILNENGWRQRHAECMYMCLKAYSCTHVLSCCPELQPRNVYVLFGLTRPAAVQVRRCPTSLSHYGSFHRHILQVMMLSELHPASLPSYNLKHMLSSYYFNCFQ